jgi:hypothetical protein
MRTTAASTNPWGNTIDDGWKDLVVSSAPPPPPAREDAPVKNRALPNDFNTWQEHGSRAAAAVEAPVDEPSFSSGDRRLWVIAGSLMGAATLVLAVLGVLTFGSSNAPVVPVAATVAAPVAVDAPHAAQPARSVEAPRAKAAPAVITKSTNPRVLKTAAHSSRGRHHKRLATR